MMETYHDSLLKARTSAFKYDSDFGIGGRLSKVQKTEQLAEWKKKLNTCFQPHEDAYMSEVEGGSQEVKPSFFQIQEQIAESPAIETYPQNNENTILQMDVLDEEDGTLANFRELNIQSQSQD